MLSDMIRTFLERAATTVGSVDELAARWQVTRIELSVVGGARLATDRAFGGRVRGALGHRLREGASAAARDGKACDWQAPCAYDVLFNTHGNITPRLEIPKPWALAVGGSGDDLAVSLYLFGIAGNWAGDVADALVRALCGGIGGHRLKVADRAVEVQRGVAVPDPARAVMLEFRTPLMLRQGREFHAKPDSLLKSIGNRISGLARWHGMALVPDRPGFLADVTRLSAGAVWEELARLPDWTSHSARQGRGKSMGGYLGRLLLPAPGQEVANLLAAGETAQAGSHSTHGLGRFRLYSLP